jgi:hypothetical protein
LPTGAITCAASWTADCQRDGELWPGGGPACRPLMATLRRAVHERCDGTVHVLMAEAGRTLSPVASVLLQQVPRWRAWAASSAPLRGGGLPTGVTAAGPGTESTFALCRTVGWQVGPDGVACVLHLSASAAAGSLACMDVVQANVSLLSRHAATGVLAWRHVADATRALVPPGAVAVVLSQRRLWLLHPWHTVGGVVAALSHAGTLALALHP